MRLVVVQWERHEQNAVLLLDRGPDVGLLHRIGLPEHFSIGRCNGESSLVTAVRVGNDQIRVCAHQSGKVDATNHHNKQSFGKVMDSEVCRRISHCDVIVGEQGFSDKDAIFQSLKDLYRKKVLPLEIASKFSHFGSPPLGPSDFDASRWYWC